jgi:LCP family protein required for cell wall assembly
MIEPKENKQSVNFLAPDSENTLADTPAEAKKINKPFILYFIIGLIVIVAAFFGIRSLFTSGDNGGGIMNVLRPRTFGFLDTVKNFFFSGERTLAGEEKDRINILLLGIGGPGHDGPYLSDTNIIVSIKPSTKEVSLISIPRDLGVKIENYGVYRVNYADALGEQKSPGRGGEYARQIFSESFKLDIPYYIRVNFSAFEQLIDAVGGVDVAVERPFTDYSFPGPDFSYRTVSFASGTQHMYGEAALQYSRSRHGTNGENSDFARARRQQQIIAALKDKVLSFGTLTSPATLQKIWSSLNSNIDTNLEFSQMVYLASIARDIDTGKIKNLVLDSSPNGYLYSYIAPTGAFMLAPKGGNLDAVNLAIANIFEPNFISSVPVDTTLALAGTGPKNASGTATGAASSASIPTSTFANDADQRLAFIENANIEIQNGTWRAGLASRLQNRLADQGFSIITVGNSVKRPVATTTVYLISQSVPNELVNYLIKQTNGRLEMTTPSWLHEDYDNPETIDNEMGAKFNPDTDILIILGADSKE